MMDGQLLMFKLCADNLAIVHKVHRLHSAYVLITNTTSLLGVQAFASAHFGQGTGPILLDNVACSGSQSTLLQCSYGTTTSDDTHSEDAGARCQPC